MRFAFVDSIIELERGKRIVTVRAVTLGEEYLADHFPTFPVLPGVLMLQALVESATWLVREAQDFAPGVVLLRQAKNVTYKSFVKPGHLLRVEVACRRLERGESDFEGSGLCDNTEVVRARFSLIHRLPEGRDAAFADAARRSAEDARTRFPLLKR